MVETIAHQCAYSGGPAVYLARSIYLLIDASLEYDDDATCLIQGVFRQAPNTKNDPAETSLVLMPNPASNNVEVQFGMQSNFSCKIMLCDFQKKNIRTFNLPCQQGKFNLDLSGMRPGIYFVKLLSGETVVKSSKLSIIN